MDNKIRLIRNLWSEMLYFNIVYKYILITNVFFFKPSFRPSGPGSAASSLNFSTLLGEPSKNAGGDGWCELRGGAL